MAVDVSQKIMRAENAYLDYATAMEASAATQLGRPLQRVELKGIRNACGGQMLESVDHAIQAGLEPEELSKRLIEAGSAFDARLTEFRIIAERGITDLLERAPLPEELLRLRELSYWTDYLSVFIRISEMPVGQREVPEIREG